MRRTTIDILESLFAEALKLEPLWEITKVEFNQDKGSIDVFVDFLKGSVFRCPVCGEEAKAYDTTEKRFRHLNFFQYACYMVVRVPRITVTVPTMESFR